MLMNMVQSRKVKYVNITYKENITSMINPYKLVGEIQGTEEALWDRKNKCKKDSLAGIHNRICFLMTKCRILHGESLFRCDLSDFWDFMKTDEDPHPPQCVIMTIFQGKINPNRTLYGRFYRYLNEILCPVGTIFMYIFVR